MRRLKPRASEVELRVWLQQHQSEREDQEFSRLQEKSWDPYKPGSSDPKAQASPAFSASSTSGRGAPVRQHSSPLFPGEYRANRDDVQALTLQNLRDMYTSTARKSEKFSDKNALLLRVPTLDYEKIEELVSNLFPFMERDETNALLGKVIESIQLDEPQPPNQETMKIMTSEMLQLQGYPQTFAAMVNAIGRRRNSKAFKVEEARRRFFEDLDFSWEHLQQIRKNVNLMGDTFTNNAPDIVDVVYAMYKDYIEWMERDARGIDEADAKDTLDAAGRAQRVAMGDRIVVDGKVQYAYGVGYKFSSESIARVRENANGAGRMSINGSVPISYFRGRVHPVEMCLQPFDEADLNVFDFDIDIEVFNGSNWNQASAIRVAISNALVNLMPHTKPSLHMASFLYPDVGTVSNPKFTGKRAGGQYHWVKRGNTSKLYP
eukprot:TRINITY_DN32475_c0_g1_i1.p1 TRINITY_DN32475_c0_g1~~TRINITY_DN32475_c0_g1_i1.p1  ORF type:complete len:468 (+),score=152.60 TRINITY_DN32475_c0_g1_i1:108-1406(+)